MLGVVVTCWGFSFFLTDLATKDLETFNLNAFRFLIAFLICAVIFRTHLRRVSRPTLLWSLLAGAILSAMYAFMNLGVANTTLSNSGFLCQLTVIVTPFLSALLNRTRPPLKIYAASFLCLGGIALLTLTDGFSINRETVRGDIFCLLCGIVYAVQIVTVERAVKNEQVDPLQLGILQLGVTGAISLLLSIFTEDPHFPQSKTTWLASLLLAVFCTGLAFVVQSVAQKYTPATHVSLIFSLEPVIAAFVAFFFAGEVLTPRAYLGAALMVSAILLAEVDFRALFRRSRRQDDNCLPDRQKLKNREESS